MIRYGSANDLEENVFDREKIFIERYCHTLTKTFPGLKIVLEHITTQDAADFVTESPSNVAATITAHHLLMNRNDMF